MLDHSSGLVDMRLFMQSVLTDQDLHGYSFQDFAGKLLIFPIWQACRYLDFPMLRVNHPHNFKDINSQSSKWSDGCRLARIRVE